MDKHRKIAKPPKEALSSDLETEITRLVTSAQRDNPVEAVMRIRALADMSASLGTEQLVALAGWVTAQNGARDFSQLAS